MATFLDIAGQEYIGTIMVFLLVVVGVYAMLSSVKFFSAPHWVYALLATIMAFFVVISPTATNIARNVGPWFAVLFVLMLFVMMAGKMVGGDGGETLAKTFFYVFIFFMVVFSIGPTAREGANIPGDNSTGDVALAVTMEDGTLDAWVKPGKYDLYWVVKDVGARMGSFDIQESGEVQCPVESIPEEDWIPKSEIMKRVGRPFNIRP